MGISTNSTNEQSIKLSHAQRLIIDECRVLPQEAISLADSLMRYPASSLRALEPLPGYDQSLRDGYAVGAYEAKYDSKSSAFYKIIDEVAAGDTRQLALRQGEAIRIMTGGLLPAQCKHVIPQELCEVRDDGLKVSVGFFEQKRNYIHARGSELAKGLMVLPFGRAIRPEQQILLAGVGYETVQVVRKPRVSFFCTGSELMTDSEMKQAGKKFSANTHLLHGLIRSAGAELLEELTVKDKQELVSTVLGKMCQSKSDIIISTGGMGPGKFDLIEDAFCREGGRVVYGSLYLRPGKSTLFGKLGSTLFFGMPGPPPAVHFLFNELIRPAILALQGATDCTPKTIQALLTEDLLLSKSDLPRFKSGLLQVVDGRCVVQPVKRVEALNCYIYCPERRNQLSKDEPVSVHLLESSCFG